MADEPITSPYGDMYLMPVAIPSVGECYCLTAKLRWRGGILEQMWQGSRGTVRWQPVPIEEDHGGNSSETPVSSEGR